MEHLYFEQAAFRGVCRVPVPHLSACRLHCWEEVLG